MPIIPIYLTSQIVHDLHSVLVEIYRERDQPIKVDEGLNYPGIIDTTCDFVTRDTLFGQRLFKNFFHRAAYLMFHLNRGHPFIDGNKRTSLFSVYYFLRWNGYYLHIPKSDAPILFEIADLENDKVCVSDAYVWLLSRIRCSPRTLAYHLSIYLLIRLARFLKNPDFYHFVSTWMFMTPPAFVTAAIKEGPDSEIITGPEDHDSRYSRD